MSRARRFPALVLSSVLAACSADAGPLPTPTDPLTPELGTAPRAGGSPATTAPELEAAIVAGLTELATRIEANVRLHRPDVVVPGAWWMGDPRTGGMGGEVIFRDRGHMRLGIEWVAGDPRRNGRADVGYAIGQIDPGFVPVPPGLGTAEVEGAVDRAMATWGSQPCSPGLTMPRGSLLDWPLFDSDILHAGFGALPPGVLGVTLPFVFIDAGTGDPTDLDGDHRDDYAFAVIVYTDAVPWAVDANIDVETVALHEAGHALGQDHFGTLFRTHANGRFHFAPRSVMNAGYTGVQQVLTGTDEAGHCGVFGSWPVG